MSDTTRSFVLALFPFTRGYAFVLFDGPHRPFEWAVKEIKEKHKVNRVLEDVQALIERYRPDRLVIEDMASGWMRRASWIRKLYRLLAQRTERDHVDIYRMPKRYVTEYFGPISKHKMAKVVAVQLPAIAHRIPPARKAWTSEDPRQALFDAAALGVVYYGLVHRSDEL